MFGWAIANYSRKLHRFQRFIQRLYTKKKVIVALLVWVSPFIIIPSVKRKQSFTQQNKLNVSPNNIELSCSSDEFLNFAALFVFKKAFPWMELNNMTLSLYREGREGRK